MKQTTNPPGSTDYFWLYNAATAHFCYWTQNMQWIERSPAFFGLPARNSVEQWNRHYSDQSELFKTHLRRGLLHRPRMSLSAYSDPPVKSWNFCRDEWNRCCPFTGKSFERLPTPDTTNIKKAYQELCESLLFAVKQSIPRGSRRNYVPCWERECETFCCSFSFLRAPVGTSPDRSASSLLSWLNQNQKRQKRWEEAVNFIDF